MTLYYTTLNNKFIYIKIIIDTYKKIVYNNIVINKKTTEPGRFPAESEVIMKKNEYAHFYMDGNDSMRINEKPFKQTKIVYQKSKYEYVAEIVDNEYNISYIICLYGKYAKGTYKSRHHSIKILNDMPSYYYFNDLIRNYYVECCPFARAYRDIVRILVRDYGCLDAYSLYLINEIFNDVYNNEMR